MASRRASSASQSWSKLQHSKFGATVQYCRRANQEYVSRMTETFGTEQIFRSDELKCHEPGESGHHDDVPEWHKHILDVRQRAFEEGRIKVFDWEEAKRQIAEALR
jgi:hypothetical protein